MNTPIWFLDVDGVVNAAGVDRSEHLVRTEATTAGTTWPIRYSTEVVEFINMVHRSGLAEVRWLTTWSKDARKSLAPSVGLDDFTAYDMYDSEDWWKAEVVYASIVEEERPIIWTDDDIGDEEVTSLTESGHVPALLIQPRIETGLASNDLRHILEFATACTHKDLM